MITPLQLFQSRTVKTFIEGAVGFIIQHLRLAAEILQILRFAVPAFNPLKG
jgi:hypothetical protein